MIGVFFGFFYFFYFFISFGYFESFGSTRDQFNYGLLVFLNREW